ncbi:hypothetical protein [Marinitoga sp. 1138]|uniref:hypothetical protein n=1 Tax=Marinitoga sp. 1138 TaxID=1643334 RepID=UPI001585E98A|nr:hypothetical protein [Marinitoga sp. 1138]NUU98039.1 hypothetical protein [Marinitoga sp. 1138]
MKKLYIIFIIILLLSSLLSSCIDVRKTSQNDNTLTTNEENNENDVEIADDEVLVKMDFSGSLINETNTKAIDEQNYYIIVVSVKNNNYNIYKLSEIEKADLKLKKGDIYIIGVAKKNEEGWIETIGIVGVEKLNTFPIFDEADKIIDLGKLIFEKKKFKSGKLNMSQFSKVLKIDDDVLESFGDFDVTLKKFMNLDINHNGILDSEEDKEYDNWEFKVFYSYSIDNENIKTIEKGIEIIFENVKNKEFLEGNAFLSVLVNGEYLETTFQGQPFKIKDIQIESAYYDNAYHVAVFIPLNNPLIDEFPFNGDYQIKLKTKDGKEKIFYFNNMQFLTFENFGIPVPSYVINAYSDGKIKNLEWDWSLLSEERLVPVKEKLVNLVMDNTKKPYFEYLTHKEYDEKFEEVQTNLYYHKFSNKYYIENSQYLDQDIDIDNENIWVSNFSAKVLYETIGNNVITIYKPIKFMNIPHDYVENKGFIDFTPKAINGDWINLSYNKNEKNPFDTFFYKINIDIDSKVAFLYFYNETSMEQNKNYNIELSDNVITFKDESGNQKSAKITLYRNYMILEFSDDYKIILSRKNLMFVPDKILIEKNDNAYNLIFEVYNRSDFEELQKTFKVIISNNEDDLIGYIENNNSTDTIKIYEVENYQYVKNINLDLGEIYLAFINEDKTIISPIYTLNVE